VAADRWIGREILGYRVESLVGRGGMGVVYRASDMRLKRSVALKLVVPELSQDDEFRARFLEETELATSLEHPNVVPIYDAGEVDGQLYLAMRYVEGSDLKALLARDGPLEPARAVVIAAQIAAALDAAHEHGLVHRDVKPSNVLLDANEHVYLTDFGLARRLGDESSGDAGQSLGTPAYASPEQAAGGDVDGRADVYGLGCLLYECLAGTVPFPRTSELAVLFAHLHETPPPIAAYPQLDPVMATALAKDRDDRYQSCGDLVDAAREALGLRDVVLVHDRKSILLVAVGAVVLAGALAAGIALSLGSDGPAKPSTKPTSSPKVDSLQRIDPKTNKLAATIGVGNNPRTVAAGFGRVWVGSADDQSVLRIDPKTYEINGRRPSTGPNSIALRPGEVYVANSDLTLMKIDPATLEFQYKANSGYRSVAVGEGAIWTVGARGLVRVNHEGRSVKTIAVGFHPFEVVTGAGAVWVLDDKLQMLFKVDPRTNRVDRIPLGFDPGGGGVGFWRVWVTDNGGDALAEINPTTHGTVHRIPVGKGPVGVAVGEGSVWTANYLAGTVSRVDPKTGKAISVRVGRNPTSIAAGEGGAWVTVQAG
jgi:serine/threonine protein kinase